MGDISIRLANPDDADFLAWVMQEADRMGGTTSSTDLTFDFGEAQRLAFLAQLANSHEDSYYHHHRFLVAEVRGVPAAALSGYVPDELPTESFERVVSAEGNAVGWSGDVLETVLAGKRFASGNFFRVAIPGTALRVEWVATVPAFRRRGLVRRLLERLLAESSARGLSQAFVGTAIGNGAALRAYQAAGFEVFAECRHVDFEALYGSPGLTFLRIDLSRLRPDWR